MVFGQPSPWVTVQLILGLTELVEGLGFACFFIAVCFQNLHLLARSELFHAQADGITTKCC